MGHPTKAAKNWAAFLFILSLLGGLGHIAAGIVSLINVLTYMERETMFHLCQCVHNINDQLAIALLSIVVIINGMVAVIVPFRPDLLLKHVFLYTYFSYGGFLLIAGMLVLGIAGDLGFGFGVVTLVLGVTYIITHFITPLQSEGYTIMKRSDIVVQG